MSQTTDVRKLFSEPELRDEFTALVIPYSNRQLARFSGCSNDATRRWIDNTRGPNLASALNVARHIPAVAEWIMAKIGHTRAAQAQSYDIWLQGLYAIAAGNGPDALKARWAIARLNHHEDQPESAPDRDTRTIDLFPQQRRRA